VIAHRQNGYLYLNGVRLVDEFEPGLFFTSDGEAVDFRSNRPTWRMCTAQARLRLAAIQVFAGCERNRSQAGAGQDAV
jgi:hypothetical protein